MSAIKRVLPEISRRAALVVGGRMWSGVQLVYHRDEMTSVLRREIRAGEPIGIVMAAEMESVAALLAVAELGSPMTLVPPTLRSGEMQAALQAARTRWLLASPGVESKPAAFGWLKGWVPMAHGHEIVLFRRADEEILPAVGLPAGSVCQLTSGSMGAPRLAVRLQSGLMLETQALIERLALEESDRVLCASSPAHSYGLVGGLLAPLIAGAHVVMAIGPQGMRDAVEAHRPTIVVGLGPSYDGLMRTGNPAWLADTRLALSAGAPLSEGLYARFVRWSGLPIRQDYGTTEVGTIAIDTSTPPAPESVGTPLPHMEVRLAPDPFAGKRHLQEVQVRSDAVARWYVEGGALHSCVDSDGWFHTRDSGVWDTQGRLQIGERLRPALRIGGMTVDPLELEAHIDRMPGVQESVVTADGAGGVRAIVVAPGVDEDSIYRWIAKFMPVQRVGVEVREALPRSPAGKVLQKYL